MRKLLRHIWSMLKHMDKMIYKITKLNPSISSENVGDDIILKYCQQQLEDIFGDSLYVNIPTRDKLDLMSRKHILSSDYAFVCGTNLLASNMDVRKQWNIGIKNAIEILNANLRRREYLNFKKYAEKQLILMGVGWWQYQGEINKYTEILLNMLLSDKYTHSVRDSYTENKLKSIGIHNVLNTSCPTMWNLTKEVCLMIPEKKASRVVTTLTNYNRFREKDEKLLEILCSRYKEVYVWLQAIEDLSYLEDLSCRKYVKIIPPNLKAYDCYLKEYETDYVGTRLHGGIRALNNVKRSLILAVDNRALEISKDTGLPVLERGKVEECLESWIEEPYNTSIILPVDNIEAWKHQFV